MIPIVLSTIDPQQGHVNVFVTSVSEYCPEADVLLHHVKGNNFGEVYNQIMKSFRCIPIKKPLRLKPLLMNLQAGLEII